MQKKTCCVTGHRDLPQKEINRVKAALRKEIEKAVADGFTRFMSGFAEGVDQYFAEIVLEMRKSNPALELVAVIPYRKRLDNLRQKKWTYEMLEACADVVVIREEYQPSVYSHRKRVYVLTNYNSTHEQDLYRVDTLRRMGFDPYVMVYERPTAPPITRHLQRWVNNKRIFRTVEHFVDYEPVKKLGGAG